MIKKVCNHPHINSMGICPDCGAHLTVMGGAPIETEQWKWAGEGKKPVAQKPRNYIVVLNPEEALEVVAVDAFVIAGALSFFGIDTTPIITIKEWQYYYMLDENGINPNIRRVENELL